MIICRSVLSRLVALSLGGLDVHYHALTKLLRLRKQLFDCLVIVSVNRAKIGKSHALKIV